MRRNPLTRFGLLLLVACNLPLSAAPVDAGRGGKRVDATIYRDDYGVPHIYAQDAYSLFYGFGYAVAADRLFQMEMSKRTVLGTVAEVLGKDYLEFDKSVRSNYSPASIEAQYEALPAAPKDIFDGYAAGMNARIDEVMANRDLLPIEYTEFGFVPSRWSPIDVIMVFVGTMANRYSDFNTEIANLTLLQYLRTTKGADTGWKMFNQLKWENDPTAPTTVPPGTDARGPEAQHGKDAEPPVIWRMSRATHGARQTWQRLKGKT